LLLAGAAATSPLPAAADQPLWEAGFGVSSLRLPDYRGSDESRTWVLPTPYVTYRGPVLRADRDGARALLFEDDRFGLDIGVSASPPTESSENRARESMPDLAPTLEIGPRLNATLARGSAWQVDLRLPLRAVITLESQPRSVGWTLAPVIDLDVEWNRSSIGFQAGPLWGDSRQHGYLYGVSPEFATASRPAYRAAGGYAGWQATAGLTRRFGPLWFGAFLRADSVAGAVFESSPLVKSRQNWGGGVALAWVFGESAERVPDDRGPGRP